MAGKEQKFFGKEGRAAVKARRFLAVFLCMALTAGMLIGIVPAGGRTAEAEAAEGSPVMAATAGDAASGVKITHSVTMPSGGGKTAAITVELESELQINRQSDAVFVMDCSAAADLEGQKEVLKSLAAMILQNPDCGANRFGLVSFSNDAEIMTEFTGDYDTFAAALDRCQAQGNANYYAGMKLAGEMLAEKGAGASKNSMVVVGSSMCNLNSAKAVRLADELRGSCEVYGLCTNAGAADVSGFLNQIAGDNLLRLGSGTDGFGDSPVQLAARLVDSPLYQNLTAEGFLMSGFKQRSLESCLYAPGFNGGAAVDFTDGRLKVTVPEFYAGESVRITLAADIIDRLAEGIVPVTGELCLRGDNLAEVSADALSIERSGYTVTYDANGGSGSVPLDGNRYEEGTAVKVKAKPADLRKDGANFSGWELSTGKTAEDGSFTMPAGDVSLKALWGRAYIQKKTNTVMKEPKRMKSKEAIGKTSAFYNSTYKSSIQSVTFLDTDQEPMPSGGDQTWDITDTNFGAAGSVMATVVLDDATQKYDLYIGAEGGIAAPEDSSSLFEFDYSSELTTIEGLEHFDTSNVTNMGAMFKYCRKLTKLDVGGFDTSHVTNMDSMFYFCDNLTELDVSKFDTSNVTTMASMFNGCTKLTELDVSGFDTSHVTAMNSMFNSCSKLTGLDLSNFDTSNATNMGAMFSSCSKLAELDLSSFNTSSVTNMGSMFGYCSNLQTLKVNTELFNTSNVTNMGGMFANCKKLTGLDVSYFNTSKVTDMNYMFSYCSGLTELDLSSFDTSKVTDMDHMFYVCSGLTGLDLSSFDTSEVTDMDYMFSYCSGLKELDLSNFDTSKVTSMESMFGYCTNLTTLNVSSFNTSEVTNMGGMFSVCRVLTGLDMGGFNTSEVTNMGSMFSSCSQLTKLEVGQFNTAKVTDMHSMFSDCSGLTTLDVSDFDTSNVTTMKEMFNDCTKLTGLDVSGFDTSKVTDMSYMFNGCEGLTGLDVSGFDTSNVTNIAAMFMDCKGLTTLEVTDFDTSKVTNMASMFKNCTGLTGLNVTNFKTSKVTNMNSMFNGCTKLATLDVSSFDTSEVKYMTSMFQSCSSLTDIGVSELNVADGCKIDNWRSGADNLPIDIKIKNAKGEQLWPEITASSAQSASVSASVEDAAAVSLPAADEAGEEPEPYSAELALQSSGNKALCSVAPEAALEYANEKAGMMEGGKPAAGQEIEYVLKLQYIGDEGGKSGELLVTDKIPEGMTYQQGSAVVSGVTRIDGGSGGLSGEVTKQPEVKDGILSFTVEGLSAGAELTVTYKCTAPAAEPAEYTEYINTASVNDSGLIDVSDPVRHYMNTRPDTFYNITYQYAFAQPDGTAVSRPDGITVPGPESVAAGRSVALPVPQERGWTFNGWKKADGTAVSDSFTPQQDTVLVGTWTKEPEQEPRYIQIQYQFSGDVPENASFILADIEEYAAEKAGVNEKVPLPDEPELPAGYADFEWTLPQGVEADGKGRYNVGESGRFAGDTIQVTGIWTKEQYQITYQYDGTVPSGAAAVPTQASHKWGGKVSLAAVPADTETHTFGGWTGIPADAAGQFEMPMADVTVTGRWMEKSIKINPNGGLWKESGDETAYSYQSYLQEKESGSFPDAVWENCVFEGWEESEDSGGSFVKVLTAKWKDADGNTPGGDPADSGSTGDNTGSTADGSGSAGDNTGSTADGSGSAGDNTGSTADGSGSAGDNTGSTADGSGSAGDNTGSTADGSGSAGDNADSTADDSGSTADSSDTQDTAAVGEQQKTPVPDTEKEQPDADRNDTESSAAEETEAPSQTEASEETEAPSQTEASEETEAPSQTETSEETDTASRMPEGENVQTVQASIDGGRFTTSKGAVATGSITETSKTTTILEAGSGAVIVTVVCEEKACTASVRDTAAVANAVLSPEQIQLVGGGETIEIRVDVKDISKTVSGQDKKVVERGLAECQKEMPGLALGTYVDISIFIKVGESDWNAVTATEEPIEVVVGIPEELKKDGREFYIIRSHDGEYTLLPDTDNDPDNITVSTDQFSAYAIAYEQTEGEASGEGRAFLGIFCLIWLAVILAILLIIWMLIRRKKKGNNV